MTHKNRNTLIIGLNVGIILLAAWLYYTPISEIRTQIAKVNYNKLFCFSCLSFRLFFGSLRWQIITSCSRQTLNCRTGYILWLGTY